MSDRFYRCLNEGLYAYSVRDDFPLQTGVYVTKRQINNRWNR